MANRPSRAAADYSGCRRAIPSHCDHCAVAPTPPNDKRLILQWPSAEHWEQWLDANHADSSGVWLKFAKKSSPTPTVSHAEALEVAMCFGWIDVQTRAHDEFFWLQRFTPRGPRSK